jgi:hypothetical protein
MKEHTSLGITPRQYQPYYTSTKRVWTWDNTSLTPSLYLPTYLPTYLGHNTSPMPGLDQYESVNIDPPHQYLAATKKSTQHQLYPTGMWKGKSITKALSNRFIQLMHSVVLLWNVYAKRVQRSGSAMIMFRLLCAMELSSSAQYVG